MPLSIIEVLERGLASSRDIQAATGLSQTAVSRQLRAMGRQIIKLTSGRSVRYAMTRNAFGASDELSLYTVDAYGNNTAVAIIRPLAHGGFFVQALPGTPSVLLGHNRDGLYDDLPYFLDDLRPQGFLGRQIATELAKQSPDFPANPKNWNLNHVGRYLIANGNDLPGNLQFGPQAALQLRKAPIKHSPDDYPALADSVMSGKLPGSSAGGEQPKFTAFCTELSAHVIVKFSPRGNDPVARRWRDILLSEYHATKALHASGYPAAKTRLSEADGRLFLESERFDRKGMYGRLPMTSLQAIDAEFSGLGENWLQVSAALYKQKLINWQHTVNTAVIWEFGRQINNSDMHLGNLSFAIEGDVFRILPVYDMCSMGFAPQSGELAPFQFTPPKDPSSDTIIPMFGAVLAMARDFWDRLVNDERISKEFQAFIEENRLATNGG